MQAAYEARETVAIAAATAAGYQRAPGGVRPSLRPRQKGDNLRWTDEEVAEWKCCAKIINGAPIDSPPFTQPTALYSSDGVLKTELEVTQARYEGPHLVQHARLQQRRARADDVRQARRLAQD